MPHVIGPDDSEAVRIIGDDVKEGLAGVIVPIGGGEISVRVAGAFGVEFAHGDLAMATLAWEVDYEALTPGVFGFAATDREGQPWQVATPGTLTGTTIMFQPAEDSDVREPHFVRQVDWLDALHGAGMISYVRPSKIQEVAAVPPDEPTDASP